MGDITTNYQLTHWLKEIVMINLQLNKVMQISCSQCEESFQLLDEDRRFLGHLSPAINGKRYRLPNPTLCPECRRQRRLAWRNDQYYYQNSCVICKRSVISIYSPDKPFPVVCPDCFWSDRWDPLEYAQDYDFSRPFFQQYAELRQNIPRISIFNTHSENSEYTVHSSKNKDCYMSSSILECEDVYYSDWVHHSHDCLDCMFSDQMELCYECSNCQGCFSTFYAELCVNVAESYLCFDCHNGKYLIGCVGLRNREFMILNQPASEQQCKDALTLLKSNPNYAQQFRQKYEALREQHPVRSSWNVNVEKSQGNLLTNTKNTSESFQCLNMEDCRYCFESLDSQDCMDCDRMIGEMLYECEGIVDFRFGAFCNLVYHSDNMYYCDNSQASSECFGGMSLKQNRYCILNKQYSKAEYYEILPKIISNMREAAEWGEFFPHTLSSFGYQETKAHEWYPLEYEQVLDRGWNWSEYQTPAPKVAKTIPAERLPDDISQVPDEVLDWAISCEVSGKPFKIVPRELAFYRKQGLPIPRRSPRQRHLDRLTQQIPRRLFDRDCDRCHRSIRSSYQKGECSNVFCEECYLGQVY